MQALIWRVKPWNYSYYATFTTFLQSYTSPESNLCAICNNNDIYDAFHRQLKLYQRLGAL